MMVQDVSTSSPETSEQTGRLEHRVDQRRGHHRLTSLCSSSLLTVLGGSARTRQQVAVVDAPVS